MLVVKKLINYVSKCALFCVIFLAAGCGLSRYGSLGNDDTPIPTMEKIRSGKLESGLQYYILENHKPENRAYITLAVNAGSVLEEDDERGLAHFSEHMAFDGTERFPGTGVVEYLRTLGMRFGADVNAYTTFDRTVYGIEVPVEQNAEGIKVLPQRSLEIIDDWTRAVTFSEKDVNEERPIIMEEYRTRLGVGQRASEKLLPLIFEGSKYAERRPIGLPSVIENAPAAKLKDFYKRWYRADTMALIFVGDFDGAHLESLLPASFGIEKKSSPEPVPSYPVPAPEPGRIRSLVFKDPEVSATQFVIFYKRPWEAPAQTLRDFRRTLIDGLIDSIISERFSDIEHEVDTPFFSAYSGDQRHGKGSLNYTMGALAKQGRAKEAFTAILRQKETLLRYGILKSELERAKSEMLSGLEQAASEKEKIDSSVFIDTLTEVYLSGDSASDADWDYAAAKQMLPGIKPEDLHEALKRYFVSNDVIVFFFADTDSGAEIPSEDEIAAMLRAAREEKIEKPKEVSVDSELLGTTPVPGKITSESYDKEFDIYTWKLSNDASVIVKPTTNQNDQILLNAMAKGGTTSASDEDFISAKFAAEITNASGLASWKQPELMKKLSGKQVSVSFNASSFTRGISGSSTKGDLKTFFELLYLSFTAERSDEDILSILKDEYQTLIARRRESPEGYFGDELNKLLYNNHRYFRPVEISDLDDIDMKKVIAWSRRVRNPADYTFVFTGNIDEKELRKFVETYIASIKPSEAFNTISDPKLTLPSPREAKFYKGKEDKSTVFIGYDGNKEWTLEQGIAADVLEEYLDIVLIQEIREKLGGVYSVGASTTISPLPPPGRISLQSSFSCAPGRTGELSSAVEAEFKKVADGKIDSGNYDKAVSALIKSFETSLESNSYISGRLASYSVLFNLPLNLVWKREELYRNVRPEDISAFAKELLNSPRIHAVLYPEVK